MNNPDNSLPPLPALKHLGDLADRLPADGVALVERWAWYYPRQQVEAVNSLFQKAAIPAPTPA